ncbi:DUF427 domain-containing protein [Arthrobacter crystallopoietes]|uniref:DUF427 domain-containing protein n=1 Tax=Crystallibacter crystallopoietes TaxID=37928 RepID=UPI00111149AA|nr:DUF427 domain-containing protein [Arthrobacter crystallopoietes]
MEIPEPFVEPTQRRIRVRLGNELVADSTRAQLLVQYGPGSLPTYYVPREDVVPGVLTDEVQAADGGSRWTVQSGRKRAESAAWSHEEPAGNFAALAGHVTFSWRQLDWYEEDEQVFVHARDPYKRVDTLHSSRRVQVFIGGEEIANSIRPLLLFETHLPIRYYLPFEDVRTGMLEPSTKTTTCPYKGRAQYWSVRAGGQLEPDIVWSYAEPIPENPKIRGLLSFYNERVDLVVDGEPLERPVTPFS